MVLEAVFEEPVVPVTAGVDVMALGGVDVSLLVFVTTEVSGESVLALEVEIDSIVVVCDTVVAAVLVTD